MTDHQPSPPPAPHDHVPTPDPVAHGAAHTSAPPPAPGLGGPGFAVAATDYAPLAQTGLAPRSAGLGIVSLVLGAIALVLELGFVFVQVGVVSTGGFRFVGVVSLVHAVLSGLLAAAALITGGIGLARHDRARGRAGIGAGIGIAVLVSITASALYAGLIAAMT